MAEKRREGGEWPVSVGPTISLIFWRMVLWLFQREKVSINRSTGFTQQQTSSSSNPDFPQLERYQMMIQQSKSHPFLLVTLCSLLSDPTHFHH